MKRIIEQCPDASPVLAGDIQNQMTYFVVRANASGGGVSNYFVTNTNPE